jgi:hypothetical protein
MNIVVIYLDKIYLHSDTCFIPHKGMGAKDDATIYCIDCIRDLLRGEEPS